jgi:hypothetical protein
VILADSFLVWWRVLRSDQAPVSTEVPFEPRTAFAGD